MHVHFEQNTCTRTDSNLLSLSWMGKVPEDLPEEGSGWKLNRAQYYVEGWLASGNARGIVGVTFSTSHCHSYEAPPRSNFNLRGHRSEVVLVRWNEPYQKLATCDSRGVIFVWIKHEGRWSIELINDRNSQVTDFAWSHDGRMALICYRDGFILVGSVAGQRYWSSMLNMENNSVTCGVWSPDDQQVMFGTAEGQIIVMSAAGVLVTQVAVHEGFEITSMAWSCEKFNMEEAEAGREGADTEGRDEAAKSYVLAVCFKYGDIFLMSGYDDVCPIMIYTTLTGVKIDWSNCGEYLAVGGFVRLPNLQCRNELHLYNKNGSLIRWISVPSQGKPLTALTWGHSDKRLFLAAGCHLYIAWVSKQVAPLQFLCQRVIHQSVRTVKSVDKLPLPQRLRCGVKALFSPTIKSYIPDPLRLRDFVCSPPPGGERLFCTMIRHGEETSGGHYTLYLEYLGGLVPLLKGKRASKLRPDFIIYDPKIKSSGKEQNHAGAVIESDTSSESETDVFTDGCGSPRMQRRRRTKVFRPEKVNRSMTFRTLDELMFDDNLPETNRLVEVTSNIWGTKFQITGLASSLPSCLGQVVYKTSLLHLQPRQMTITIVEICPARPVLSRDPNFTPAPHPSDDDEESWTSDGDQTGEKIVSVTVHDSPVVLAEDVRYTRVDGSIVDVVPRLAHGDSPDGDFREILTFDPSSVAGKLASSGTVHSCSLPPVWNSLTQATGATTKQESVEPHQDLNINRLGQAVPNKPHPTTYKSQVNNCSCIGTTRDNLPYSSPKLNGGGGNNKRTLSAINQCGSFNSQNVAVTSGDATDVTFANRANYFHSSPPLASAGRRPEPAFKWGDVGGCLERGTFNRKSVEGTWRREEPVSLPLFRDQAALSQHYRGSSCTEGGNVRIPLGDPIKCEVPRWADPASPSTKLLEEGQSDSPSIPLENNLVADCSPTAPNCLDLHRRLYLAQQNFLDTGSPISPSNCPSCLPHLSSLTTDFAGSPHHFCVLSPLPSFQAEHGRAQATPVISTPAKEELSIKSSSDLREVPCPPLNNPGALGSDLPPKESLSEEPSALTNGLHVSSSRDHSHNLPSSGCSKCQSKRSEETNPISAAVDEAKSTRNAGSDLNHHTEDTHPPNFSTTVLIDLINQSSVSGKQTDVNLTSSQHAPHAHESHHPPPTSSFPAHATHSQLPKDLSSFEKLSLILSEDPSVQSSVHNFRSMPGFVMKNPDLKLGEDQDSSSSEKDISETSDETLQPSVFTGDALLSNHVHDMEIQQTSASLPSSPIRFGSRNNPNTHRLHEEMLRGRCRHLSPLLGRRGQDILPPVSDLFGVDDPRLNHYETLEMLQKSQLKQKVRHRLNESCSRHDQNRTFIMHNKAPLWNETSQVYQLDFGGRVTQESAKNFQIELRGKQVMQFGRIDNNAYTLDFQHPFTAVQAFAVALANVTQRLK